MPAAVISVIIPIFNEAENIAAFYNELEPVIAAETHGAYELIYVDDGSTDRSIDMIRELHGSNPRIRLVGLSKNFGKEIALAAGIAEAKGEAMILMDGDGQFPAERVPDFIAAWRSGAQVVVGVRTQNEREGAVKKYGSKMFYWLFNNLSGSHMVSGSTDFRLIDKAVQQEFIKLHEPQSITRGLIDWLGFQRTYISFHAKPRRAGTSGYKFSKLIRLAAHSFVSLSPVPLYAFGYLGVFITMVSLLLGMAILVEQILLSDPWQWRFTGTAMLSVLVLFLVGLVLAAQGVLALYISYIYSQSKARPLYVVNPRLSLGSVPHDRNTAR